MANFLVVGLDHEHAACSMPCSYPIYADDGGATPASVNLNFQRSLEKQNRHASCWVLSVHDCIMEPLGVAGRRLKPSYTKFGRQLMTVGPSYYLQYPFFLMRPFNSDPEFVKQFNDQWLAEKAFFHSSAYYVQRVLGLGVIE